MKYSQANLGRILVVRLEDGDRLDQSIEELAKKEKIYRATVIAIGGADKGSKLVVGPKEGRAEKIEPMLGMLEEVHEIAAVGTIFPNEGGIPKLHMHASCGRGDKTITGCVRAGVDIWHIGEVIIFELVGNNALRKKDGITGFDFLNA